MSAVDRIHLRVDEDADADDDTDEEVGEFFGGDFGEIAQVTGLGLNGFFYPLDGFFFGRVFLD